MTSSQNPLRGNPLVGYSSPDRKTSATTQDDMGRMDFISCSQYRESLSARNNVQAMVANETPVVSEITTLSAKSILLGTLASALCEMPSTVTKRAAKHRGLEPRFYLRLNVGIVMNILLKIPGAAVTASGLQVAS